MSYIRCLSNPESLYIWGDGRYVNISKGKRKTKIIPDKTFDGLLKKYIKNFGEDTIYKGASIKEIFVESKKQTKSAKAFKIKSGKFQMRLSYKDWHIDMWKVTWEYIVNNERKNYYG